MWVWGGVCGYFSVNLRAFQSNLLPSATRMQVADYSETSADFSKGVGRHDSDGDNFHIYIPMLKPQTYLAGTNHSYNKTN